MFDNGYFKEYFGKVKQQRREDILALMHLAVDLNQKEWFYELAEQYDSLWGI